MTWIIDVTVVAGLALVVYGVSLIHKPSAWIVAGLGLIGASVVSAAVAARKTK